MLYQNGFPVGYNPSSLYQAQPSPYTLQQSNQPQQQSSNGIIWVQGEAGAKSYMLAPNTTLALWDSEANVIYLKSTDASGMPSIKTLKYTIEQPQNPTNQLQQDSQVDMKDYIRRDEFNQYMEAFNTHVLAEFSKQLKEVFNNGKSDISTNAEAETSATESNDGTV